MNRLPISHFILILFSILLLSCTANSPHDSWIRGADKIEVLKLKDGNTSLVTTITEQKKLDYFRYLLDFGDTEAYKCGYSGVAKVYQGSKVMEISIQVNPDCQHVAYFWEGKNYYKELTHDGVKVFTGQLK